MIAMAQAVLLGILQGITEFLPVSSSGHLVITKNLFNLNEPDLFFDTMVHFGTLIPVLLIFKEDLGTILRKLFTLISQVSSQNQCKKALTDNPQLRLIGLIGIAIVPTAVIGILFKDLFERLFASVLMVGISLVLTGTLLSLTRIASHPQKKVEGMTFVDAIVIGFSQALAITPGISRSGATISIALFLGIDRELAGRFSFLILIPAVLGAIIVNFRLPETYVLSYFSIILAGTTAAAITGYFSLRVLLRFVRQGKLYCFSPYCYGVGLFAILFAILR